MIASRSSALSELTFRVVDEAASIVALLRRPAGHEVPARRASFEVAHSGQPRCEKPRKQYQRDAQASGNVSNAATSLRVVLVRISLEKQKLNPKACNSKARKLVKKQAIQSLACAF